MKLFEFDCYRDFLKEKFLCMPGKGRGELRKMSEFMNVHTTTMSQVYRGTKPLTSEQAISFARYWKLNEQETEYLLIIVQLERAGSDELKKVLKRQAMNFKQKGQSRKSRLKSSRELSESESAKFYSNWYYSAARILTSISEFQTVEAIAEHLGLRSDRITEVMEFLLETGLCKEKNGKFLVGPTHTHIEPDATYIRNHHMNWRVKAAENYDLLTPVDYVFTAPFSISRKDQKQIRKKLVKLLDEITEIVENSKPEILCSLNIDCLEVKR